MLLLLYGDKHCCLFDIELSLTCELLCFDVLIMLLCNSVCSCFTFVSWDLTSVWYFFINDVCFFVVDKHGMILLVRVCLRL